MNKKIISAIAILTISLCLVGCKDDNSQQAPVETNTNVIVEEVKKQTIEKALEYTGEVKASASASVTAKVSGSITAIYKDVGDYVTAGTALMTVDSSQYQQAYNQALAAYNQALASLEMANASKQQAISSYNNVTGGNLEQNKINLEQAIENAQSSYDNALDNYNRQLALFEIGAISQVALNTAKTNLDTAERALNTAKTNAELNNSVISPQTEEVSKAGIQQAEAGITQANATIEQAKVALEIAETNLNNCTVTSPISGYIASKNANPGQLASPGVEIFSIQNSEMVDIEINVTESAISSIAIGTKANISINSADISDIEGTVSLVSEVKDKSTGMYVVKISVPNNDKKIKIGMLADVKLITEKITEVIAIDNKAIIQKNDTVYVYIAEGDNAVKKEITVGISDGKITEVISGLEVGDKVITEGKDFITDKNTKIKVIQN